MRDRFPLAKVFALHAGELPVEYSSPPDSYWYPGSGISINNFLESEIPDCDAKDILLLEWRPALSVYGKSYLSLIEASVEFIKRIDANTRTTRAFGSRWFKNFIKNLITVKKIIHPEVISRQILITGAGPSLETAIDLIKSEKLNFYTLATASSVPALEAQGLIPDLLISTDGGNWAKYHLNECLRSCHTMPLAISLTGTLPSQCEDFPLLLMANGSLWQSLILNELKIPHIILPSRGTVTASALDLAFALTGENIFIAGMDLANDDIRSHARPYSFDRFFEDKENRFTPFYSQTYSRSSLLKQGKSFGIYANWFKTNMDFYPRPIYSLGTNNPVFNSISPSLSLLPLPSKKNNENLLDDFNIVQVNSADNLSQRALAILEKKLREEASFQETSGASIEETPFCILHRELSSLLYPGETNITSDDLIKGIYSGASG